MPAYTITFWSAHTGRPIVFPLPDFTDEDIVAAAQVAEAGEELLRDGAQGLEFPAFVVFHGRDEIGGN